MLIYLPQKLYDFYCACFVKYDDVSECVCLIIAELIILELIKERLNLPGILLLDKLFPPPNSPAGVLTSSTSECD